MLHGPSLQAARVDLARIIVQGLFDSLNTCGCSIRVCQEVVCMLMYGILQSRQVRTCHWFSRSRHLAITAVAEFNACPDLIFTLVPYQAATV
jgi:hypothetical protein